MSGLTESAFQRRVTGQLAHGFLHFQAVCSICGVKRSTGSHKKCSQVRQAKYREVMV
jgi:hypothetical protein